MTKHKMTALPCPRCLPLAKKHDIRAETLQPLPAQAPPLGMDGKPCCFDCQAADNLMKTARSVNSFIAARIAVGNTRQEQYRLPGIPLGLVQAGLVRPSVQGDLEKHYEWLEENRWFGIEDDE